MIKIEFALPVIVFLSSYMTTFEMFNWNCFSTVCLSSTYKNFAFLEGFAYMLYFLLMALFFSNKKYLSTRVQNMLHSEFPLFVYIKNKMAKGKYLVPSFTYLETLHCLFACGMSAAVYFMWNKVRVHSSMTQTEYWNVTCRITGHLPEFMFPLLLIPITRNSFFSQVMNIPISQSVVFHQISSNLFGLGMVIHFGACFVKWSLDMRTFWTNSLLIGEEWAFLTWDQLDFYTGLVPLILFIVIRLSSMKAIRRHLYNVFWVMHLLLPIPITIVSILHATAVKVFVYPALTLYILDISVRFYHMIFTRPVIFASVEECGWIRIDIKGYTINRVLRHGLFVHLRTKELSKYFAHPFSVASFYDRDHCVLIIKPTNKVNSATRQLYDYVKRNISNRRNCNSVEVASDSSVDNSTFVLYQDTLSSNDTLIGSHLKGIEEGISNQIPLSGSINGPFGNTLFDFDKISKLVCIVGGSGITAVTLLIQEFIELCPEKEVYLIWTVREEGATELSIVKELVASKHANLYLEVYQKYECDEKNPHFLCINARLDAEATVKRLVKCEDSTLPVGVVTCGPSSLMKQVFDSCQPYSDKVLVKSESYEW
ncbi:hypothetical protein BC833DRAFT_609783 [Globomyces pollinis-pini]|nr:hypothetical protein BC833DRAFT_609783 [Globomyces pollinis-pini]